MSRFARQLATQNAIVVINDIVLERTEETVDDLRRTNLQAYSAIADTSDRRQVVAGFMRAPAKEVGRYALLRQTVLR